MRKIFLFFLLSEALVAYAQTLQPTENEALLNVTVTNFKNVPRKNETIIFEGIKTKKIFSGISNSIGKFSILIPKGDTYNIKIKNFGDNVDYNKVEIPNKPGKMTSNITVQMELPKTYTLKNVFFDTGKATLKNESFKALNDLVEVMKIKNTMFIEIAGHTDNVGSPESNIKLSGDRANAVRNYLLQKGVQSARVTAKGYGDTQPVEDNSTETGKQKNRRTEVRIISE